MAEPCQVEDTSLALELSQPYNTALVEHPQTVRSFNVASNLVSVPFLSGSRRKRVVRVGTLFCSFRLRGKDVRDTTILSGTTSKHVTPYRDTSFSRQESSHSQPEESRAKCGYGQLNTFFDFRSSSTTPHGLDTPQARYPREKLPSL